MKTNNPNPKETIYIDAEDDITLIIEKVRTAEAKIVALVLPKRATTLQSLVNLKLLKKTAKETKKSIILITTEAGLLPVAGAAGLHIAESLQSKPEIPKSPKVYKNTSTNTVASKGKTDDNETEEQASSVDNQDSEDIIDLESSVAEAKTLKSDKQKIPFNKKLKIPNFNRFRLFLFGGIGLLILLIIGGIFAFVVLPKASITIKTDTSNISTGLTIALSADTSVVDAEKLTAPAITKQLKKTDSEKAPATGQRDDGEKAKGTVTLTNCTKGSVESVTVPEGTLLSSNDTNFITNETVKIAPATFIGGITCTGSEFKNVSVTAQNPGGQYNIGANRSFSVSGFSGITGKNGSAMNGGTSNIVKVVSQSDIDNAKQKVLDKLNTVAVSELKDQFITDNALALTDTFSAGQPTVVSTPNLNDPSSEVSVTVTMTFSEIGIKNDDLKNIVENDIKKHIDASKQIIQDNGLSSARIQIVEKISDKEVKFNVQTLAIAGPQLDEQGIKNEIAGKKKTETESIILSRPGIKDINISYSPFWVYQTPKNIKHITIKFEQNDATP